LFCYAEPFVHLTNKYIIPVRSKITGVFFTMDGRHYKYCHMVLNTKASAQFVLCVCVINCYSDRTEKSSVKYFWTELDCRLIHYSTKRCFCPLLFCHLSCLVSYFQKINRDYVASCRTMLLDSHLSK